MKLFSLDTSAKSSLPIKNKIPTLSLAEQAYLALKKMVLLHEISAGDQLNLIELSDRLQLGRTPLHMAIHRLAAEGLLEIVPRKGIFVREETLGSFHELLAARLLIEPYLARMAAINSPPGLIKRLEDVVMQAKNYDFAGDRQGSMLADRLFHQTMYAAANNSMLATFASTLLDRSMRLWYQPLSSSASKHHKANSLELQAMLDVFKQGQAEAVESSMRHHIETVRKKYLDFLIQSK